MQRLCRREGHLQISTFLRSGTQVMQTFRVDRRRQPVTAQIQMLVIRSGG